MSTIKSSANIRNLAIIAHVDHGKTTLVDQLFRQGGVFRESQAIDDRVMDNMDLERERGITIAAKNCSVKWQDVKINILDTPGHADFGGEVERALMMVDGAVLLVDSSEGPLPQTRFVLAKALKRNLPIIVVINKVDRKDARPNEVLNEIYDLFIDLDAREDQLDFPVLYAIGREGIADTKLENFSSPETRPISLDPLFKQIIETITPPTYDSEEPFQLLVLNLGYSDFLGRLAIGKVVNGESERNDRLVRIDRLGEIHPLRVVKFQTYQGIELGEVDKALPGEIVVLAGAEEVEIGDTITIKNNPKALPRVKVDDPTISMIFSTNTSPLSGREGKWVQSQKIRERLLRETLINVALQVEETDDADSFVVKGRGEFQMAILVETMRREGFELGVGRPMVILRQENNETLEPIEQLLIDCDEGDVGVITQKLAQRKGRLTNMINHGSGRVRLEFSIPSRGLVGYRNEFLTDTRGTGIMNSLLSGYEPYRGEFESRTTGSLVSDRAGEAVAYALYNLEARGKLFVRPGAVVYEGMIIGENNREDDLNVNPCKAKKLTNIRAANKDENIALTPIDNLTIEKAIDFIKDDELVEVTPESIRLRKRILAANRR
jgi:GTP-binding protein